MWPSRSGTLLCSLLDHLGFRWQKPLDSGKREGSPLESTRLKRRKQVNDVPPIPLDARMEGPANTTVANGLEYSFVTGVNDDAVSTVAKTPWMRVSESWIQTAQPMRDTNVARPGDASYGDGTHQRRDARIAETGGAFTWGSLHGLDDGVDAENATGDLDMRVKSWLEAAQPAVVSRVEKRGGASDGGGSLHGMDDGVDAENATGDLDMRVKSWLEAAQPANFSRVEERIDALDGGGSLHGLDDGVDAENATGNLDMRVKSWIEAAQPAVVSRVEERGGASDGGDSLHSEGGSYNRENQARYRRAPATLRQGMAQPRLPPSYAMYAAEFKPRDASKQGALIRADSPGGGVGPSLGTSAGSAGIRQELSASIDPPAVLVNQESPIHRLRSFEEMAPIYDEGPPVNRRGLHSGSSAGNGSAPPNGSFFDGSPVTPSRHLDVIEHGQSFLPAAPDAGQRSIMGIVANLVTDEGGSEEPPLSYSEARRDRPPVSRGSYEVVPELPDSTRDMNEQSFRRVHALDFSGQRPDTTHEGAVTSLHRDVGVAASDPNMLATAEHQATLDRMPAESLRPNGASAMHELGEPPYTAGRSDQGVSMGSSGGTCGPQAPAVQPSPSLASSVFHLDSLRPESTQHSLQLHAAHIRDFDHQHPRIITPERRGVAGDSSPSFGHATKEVWNRDVAEGSRSDMADQSRKGKERQQAERCREALRERPLDIVRSRLRRRQSYPWRLNSCWLDSSLELIFQTAQRDWDWFTYTFSKVSHTAPIYQLFQAICQRRSVSMGQCSGDPAGILSASRDQLRRTLLDRNLISSMESPEAAFSWLASLLRDASREGSTCRQPYFQGYSTELRSCSGTSRNPSDQQHYQHRKAPRLDFFYHLGRQEHERSGGAASRWLQDLLDIEHGICNSNRCWRRRDNVMYCDGEAQHSYVHFALPTMLILELDQEAGVAWDFPPVLRPSSDAGEERHSELQPPDVQFDLVGRLFYCERNGHFFCHAIDSAKPSDVYQYDGLQDSGRCRFESNEGAAALSGSRYQPPPDCRTQMVIYHLRGGRHSQESILSHQRLEIRRHCSLHITAEDNSPVHIVLQKAGVVAVPDGHRPWLVNPCHSHTTDYEVTVPSQDGVQRGDVLEHVPLLPVDNNDPAVATSVQDAESSMGSAMLPNRAIQSASSDVSSLEFRCRCGRSCGIFDTTMDALQEIKCERCNYWSHVACQREGRASNLKPSETFVCDLCAGYHLPTMREGMVHSDREGATGSLIRTPMTTRLIVGKGALAHHGKFWYPVRLLARLEGPFPAWQVVWWRYCIFPADVGPPYFQSPVPEKDLVDELWADRTARRSIRLGRWKHACDVDEDGLLLEPDAYPFSAEIDRVLRPHIQALTQLVEISSLSPSFACDTPDSDIPALHAVREARKRSRAPASLKSGVIADKGDVSMADYGRIINWIYHEVPGAKGSKHAWFGCVPCGHATTLVILSRCRAKFMQDREFVRQRTEIDKERFLLQQAWKYQQTATDPDGLTCDVDRECILSFERRLFEVSANGGLASYDQWGLDAGDHQEKWYPYQGLPSDWRQETYAVSDSELEKGPDYSSSEEDPASLANRIKARAAPRPKPRRRVKP